MTGWRLGPVLGAAAALGGAAWGPFHPAPQAPPAYHVYAVRYATIPQFRVRALLAGADSTRRLDLVMMVWVLRGGGRTVLVDAGFYRDKFMRQWKPASYIRPDSAIAPLGLKAGDVTDLIISHVHWDHLDGADLFPAARVWIQREEYQYYVGPNGEALKGAIDSLDARMLARLNAAGRVSLVEGDAQEPIPGIRLYTGGKHTWASQYAGVSTPAGTVIIASDNAYLYENLDAHRPIAQTLDSASNLSAQARMVTLAASPRLIVPGHDPAVFERFPTPGNGVAMIAPAQSGEPRRYTVETMIPVKTPDGATVCAIVARPNNTTERLPALLSTGSAAAMSSCRCAARHRMKGAGDA